MWWQTGKGDALDLPLCPREWRETADDRLKLVMGRGAADAQGHARRESLDGRHHVRR